MGKFGRQWDLLDRNTISPVYFGIGRSFFSFILAFKKVFPCVNLILI